MEKVKLLLKLFLLTEILLLLVLVGYEVVVIVLKPAAFSAHSAVFFLIELVLLFLYMSKINIGFTVVRLLFVSVFDFPKNTLCLVLYSILLVGIVRFGLFILAHQTDYLDVDNWQYFNHQPHTSEKLDILIGTYYTMTMTLITLFSVHLLLSVGKQVAAKARWEKLERILE